MKRIYIIGICMTIAIILMLVGIDTAMAIPAPIHKVNFMADGLPNWVYITVNWTKIEPGTGEPVSGSIWFSNPGPSDDVITAMYSTFVYSGFPESVTVRGDTYSLISISPTSPFVTGGYLIPTTVIATYAQNPPIPTPELSTYILTTIGMIGLFGLVKYDKKIDMTEETTVKLEKTVTRGDKSWNYFAVAWGILSVIIFAVESVLDIDSYTKIKLMISSFIFLIYLCFFNKWFRNKIVIITTKSQEMKERY